MNRLKGIIILFMVLIVSAFPKITVKAETVDDLREIIGKPRATSLETIFKMEIILGLKEDTDEVRELANRVSNMENKLRTRAEKEFKRLSKEKENKEYELELLMSNDASAYSVLEVLKELDSVVLELSKHNLGNITVVVNTDGINDIDAEYEKVKKIIASIDDNQDIGVIGQGLKPPTSGIFKLVDAFGEYYDTKAGTEIVKNNKIKLAGLTYDDTLIISQWNGVVSKVKDDKVIIEHGPALRTEYKGLKNIKVKAGDKVNQYDVLGKLKGKTLSFAIELDGEYIDPMRVYGVDGVKEYLNWVATNPSRIIEMPDMSGVKNQVDLTKDELVSDEDELILLEGVEKATLPSDYEAPNPGILQ